MFDSNGYETARRVIELGRCEFFGGDDDLPQGRSDELRQDDLTPQFGYVGCKYHNTKVLFLNINPGVGPEDNRSAEDELMMPALQRFANEPTRESFASAMDAYAIQCKTWRFWSRCSEIIDKDDGDRRLSFEEIAYSNCLPWRTASGTDFNDRVAHKAAELYALPLIEELSPKVVVALGKRVGAILAMSGKKLPTFVWNFAHAQTKNVKKERSSMAAKILGLLDR